MKFITRSILPLIAIAMVYSCAQTTEEDYNVIEQNSLDKWVELNAPALGLNYTKFGDGMFIEYGQADASAAKVEDGDWVYLTYTGYDINGNIFSNRYEQIAQQIGTFTPYTYYTPQLVSVTKDMRNVTLGQYEALKTMKVGQEVDLLMPSRMAYGSSGASLSNGYGGNVSLGGGKPCRFKMKVVARTSDITAYEEKLVKDYALANFSIKDENDTIAPYLYAEITQDNPNARPISEDSTFKYNHTGMFLDGFVFSSDVPEVALEKWNTIIAGTPASYKASSGGLIEAFAKIAKSGKLTYGCKFKMVLVSKYGYGTTGNSGSGAKEPYTVIQPYSPLVFEVTVQDHPKGDKEPEKPKE